MVLTKDQIYEIMRNEKYPLSLKYDYDWILENSMGSHCLWLQEALAGAMELRADMKLLDMGCGKAISSIFLAKEFGCRVWATDLWINATDNWKRICEAGVGNLVYPIHAEAHTLPFADEFFDAIVSINSLFFYAGEEDYLTNHLIRNVRPGGQIGIILPGFYKEYQDGIPDILKPHWIDQLNDWHSLNWWVDHLNKTGMVELLTADYLPGNEGHDLFMKSTMIYNTHELPLHVLAGDNITFMRIVAKRK